MNCIACGAAFCNKETSHLQLIKNIRLQQTYGDPPWDFYKLKSTCDGCLAKKYKCKRCGDDLRECDKTCIEK